MSDSVNSQWESIEPEFKTKLRTEWKRKVACQRQCEPPESCVCRCHIIHVAQLEAWMTTQASETSTNTKAGRLLGEMHPKYKGYSAFEFPISQEPLFTGDRRSLRVFGMLLQQERGELVGLFHDAQIYDKYLNLREDQDAPNHPKLREILREKCISNTTIDCIVQDYEQEKWSYCPPLDELTLHMEADFVGTKTIMPFCRRQRINNKGGTASVYWVAIQTDLIADQRLREVLEKSIYNDPDFGLCYSMALKSYLGNKKDSYDYEKAVFSGLKNDLQMPVVRYLGCYTHDYGEGNGMGKTYNLLLQFGEKDLEEYWADPTTVPPVRAVEIIHFWESLFKVAEAIRRMHSLQIPHDRDMLDYHGWHADIKPDNILRVLGEFKLADFGFSRFTPKNGKNSTPTEYIVGGTNTYAAPEFSRHKLFNTRSNVTQSIDTWSFGCVLSVAATWVALGYQGTLQYRKLREESPRNKPREGEATDRFHDHDCHQVLPEIRVWHNYVRGHIRIADTTTPLVLDLIETHMLQADSQNRYESDVLCAALKEIIENARRRISSLPQHARETDESVIRALLAMENKAEASRASGIDTTPLAQPLQPTGPSMSKKATRQDESQSNHPHRSSMRLQKEAILGSIPLGQTSHRKDILMAELKGHPIGQECEELSVDKTHNGANTESPTIFDPDPRPLHTFTREITRNPAFAAVPGDHDQVATTSRPLPIIIGPTPSTPSSYPSVAIKSFNNDQMTQGQPPSSEKNYQFASEIRSETVFGLPKPNDIDRSTATHQSRHQHLKYRQTSSSDPLSPPYSIGGDSPADTTHSQPATVPYHTRPNGTPHRELWGDTHDLPSLPSNLIRNGSAKTPVAEKAFTGRERIPYKDDSETEATGHQLNGLNITVSEDESETISSNYGDNGKQAVVEGYPQVLAYSQSNNSSLILAPPSHVYDLPWDVFGVRATLDGMKPRNGIAKGKAWFKSKVGKEVEEKDKHLATFIHNRELIFVVDNGTTMVEYWPLLKFVAETLSKKVAGLDQSGIDLRFTIKGHEFDNTNLVGDRGRRDFSRAIDRARPCQAISKDHFVATNMDQILRTIFNEWRTSSKRATTVIILTDGLWKGTIPWDAIDKTIVNFAKDELHKKRNSRHFSIGFIRFGNAGIKRLERLDNELCFQNGLEDIIDHCSWKASVNKMILGSLDSYQDQNDNDEDNLNYDQAGLNNLIESYYNSAQSLCHLSPAPSQMSGRGSNFDLHRRDTSKSGNGLASPAGGEKRKNRMSGFFG